MLRAEAERVDMSYFDDIPEDEDYYNPQLKAIADVEEWTADFVDLRSKRMLEIAWGNVSPWLGFDGEVE